MRFASRARVLAEKNLARKRGVLTSIMPNLPSDFPFNGHAVAVGPTPISRRRAFGFWKTAALATILGTIGLSGAAQAHEHEVSSPSILPITQMALSQPAQLAPNVVLERAAAGRYAWVSRTGEVDGHGLLNHWEAQGLRPEQAMELLNVFTLTQSPVLARTQEGLARASQLSRTTQDLLEIQTQQNADAFLRRYNSDRLVEKGLVSPVEALNRSAGDDATWSSVHAYWDAMRTQRFGESPQPLSANADTGAVATAQAHLQAAVDEAGLSSLRVPIGLWGNPAVLEKMAQRVREANTTLQQLTGLEGQVLGMNGRVSFSPYSPVGNGFAYQGADGGLRMDARWEDIPHELFHLYDSALRTAPVDTQAFGGSMLSQQVLGQSLVANPLEKTAQTVFSSWSKEGKAADWMRQRSSYLAGLSQGSEDDRATATYVGSASEMVAYAWGSYVQSQVGQDSVFFDAQRSEREAYDGQRGPTLSQAASMKHGWAQLFGAIRTSLTPAVVLPSIQQWRQGRAGPSVSSPVAWHPPSPR